MFLYFESGEEDSFDLDMSGSAVQNRVLIF